MHTWGYVIDILLAKCGGIPVLFDAQVVSSYCRRVCIFFPERGHGSGERRRHGRRGWEMLGWSYESTTQPRINHKLIMINPYGSIWS